MKFPKVLNTAGIQKVHAAEIKVSNAKNHGWVGYIGDDYYPVMQELFHKLLSKDPN